MSILRSSEKLNLFFIVCAFAGFLDAGFLTWSHYAQITVPCSLTHGCEKVLTSPYAVISGVPIAFLGAVYYGAQIGLSVWFYLAQDRFYLLLMTLFASGGLFISAILLYLQASVIGAWCAYCLLSASISVLLFGLVLALWFAKENS